MNSAKFCFLINGTESQGIAVQEIMSMGVPIIAWDIKEWLDQGEAYRVPATSIPYWDERCGEVFFNIDEPVPLIAWFNCILLVNLISLVAVSSVTVICEFPEIKFLNSNINGQNNINSFL